jgi:hypothetical protein
MSATMESANIGKLAEALAKAQGAMNPAKKDSLNPHFRSQYADLASCWAAIREPLSSNGLALIQRVSTDHSGVTVESTLAHVSGEFIRSSCWLPVAQKTPIAYGSAITYARRYSLVSLVGLSAEDDDGSAASALPAQRPIAPYVPPPALTVEPIAEVIQAPTSTHALVPFGKHKGKPLSSLPTKTVEWYRQAANEELANEAKAKFHPQTRQWLQQVELELANRKS